MNVKLSQIRCEIFVERAAECYMTNYDEVRVSNAFTVMITRPAVRHVNLQRHHHARKSHTPERINRESVDREATAAPERG